MHGDLKGRVRFLAIIRRDIDESAILKNNETGTPLQEKVKELAEKMHRMVEATTSGAAKGGETHQAGMEPATRGHERTAGAEPQKGLGARTGIFAACILLDVDNKR